MRALSLTEQPSGNVFIYYCMNVHGIKHIATKVSSDSRVCEKRNAARQLRTNEVSNLVTCFDEEPTQGRVSKA